ncbi:hypothetical protein PCE1_001471 [Barthelona sp. PCE]
MPSFRYSENEAAVVIQRVLRGYLTRKRVRKALLHFKKLMRRMGKEIDTSNGFYHTVHGDAVTYESCGVQHMLASHRIAVQTDFPNSSTIAVDTHVEEPVVEENVPSVVEETDLSIETVSSLPGSISFASSSPISSSPNTITASQSPLPLRYGFRDCQESDTMVISPIRSLEFETPVKSEKESVEQPPIPKEVTEDPSEPEILPKAEIPLESIELSNPSPLKHSQYSFDNAEETLEAKFERMRRKLAQHVPDYS